MATDQYARTTLPNGGVLRQEDMNTGSLYWRAYVASPARRIDRCFQDNTYGGAADAKAMAEAWHTAMVSAFLDAAGRPTGASSLNKSLAAVNLRFDTLRPRMIYVSVYIGHLDGIPCQLRALVSDRGQKLQRKELAANFRRIPMSTALVALQEKIQVQIREFFGEAVAAAFMERHGRRFRYRQFDELGTIEIHERADRFVHSRAAPTSK